MIFQEVVLFGSSEGNESSSLNKGLRLSRLHRTSRLARLARLGRLAKLAPFLHESATWKYIQGFRGVRMLGGSGKAWAMISSKEQRSNAVIDD
eukprot:g7390.t1